MTVASIRSLLRVLIDQPVSTAIWSNANLNTLIFSEYRDICNAITERFPDYFETSSSVSTTANTATTALPTTCTYFKKLVNSSGETLHYIPMSQFNHTSANSGPTGFCIVGRNIWWTPTPDAVYTYTAYYNAMPTDLSGETDVPNLPPNFHDILAYAVAVNSRIIKDEDVRDIANKYNQKMGMLLHQIGVEQTNNARRVLRVYDESEQ
jgi:hypothetical protein